MTDTVGGFEPDPDFEAQFAQLVREIEQGRPAAVREPSARARMLQNRWREQPPPTTPWRGDIPTVGDATVNRARPAASATAPQPAATRRRGPRIRRGGYGGARVGRDWPRDVVIALIVGVLIFGVVETVRQDHGHSAANDAPAAPAQSAAAGQPAADAMIPLGQLFPRTVPAADGGAFTLVQSGDLDGCIRSDMVGATLAGLFARSQGCVGGEGALYKDAAKDQFNVTVFTLADAADATQIMTDLSMDSSDFEVAALSPPPGSGLADLSAVSGIVQSFEADGDRFGVFMAQWSDGGTQDYTQLQKLLVPLQAAIGKTLAADAG